MKKIYFFVSLLLLSVFSISAQSDVSRSIRGELFSEATEEPIPQANIRVLQKSDSTFITGKASDLDGRFNIPVSNGSYILQISFIGYNDLFKDVVVSSSAPVVNLGKLTMSVDNILLSETVVTAKAAEIVVKGDTLEYNADSYKVTESAVVEDLLKKMPGVEIDTEGNITVNGRAITKILVDGEEFFSNDPKVASKNLPANMVEKLQVLERRSEMAQMTGFDDGEEENVINLTVRPGMKEGLFGSAFAGYGSKDRYEANVMVNYMKNNDQYTVLGGINNTNNAGFSDLGTAMFGSMGGRGGRGGMFGGTNGISTSGNIGGNFSKEFSSKFKLGGNVRYGYTDTDIISDEFTQNILSAGNTLEDESNRSNNLSENFNMDLRLEWDPNEYTKLIFRPNASIYNNSRSETGEFNTLEELTGDRINDGHSDYYSEGKGSEVGGRLDFSRKLGDDGRVISAQLSGNTGNSENNGTSISETMYYRGTRPNDLIDQRFTNINDNNSWRGYISYVEPIGKNNFIQLAYQYRKNVSISDRDTRTEEELGSGNYNVLDTLYSKRLDNNFIRQELELNFQSIREKYDYMVGFSMQPSSSRNKTFIGEQIIDTLRQDVINFAPMAQFNYRWNRNSNLRIRYFGSTNQPSVNQLSPVIDISDPLNIRFGNPDLTPSFEHRLNVRYRSSNPEKASSFNAFANAGYMTNDVVSLTATDISSGRKITTYENIQGNWNANGRVMMNIPFKNIKFSLFSMSFASYNHSNGYTGTYTGTNEIVNPDDINIIRDSNLSKRLNLSEVLGINYRSDQFDFSVRGNVSYNNVTNSLEGQRDQEYFNYGANASTSIYLPLNFTLESDINYNTNSGYADGFEQNEWLWNASLQKTIFKQKNGTIRFKIYDILQQRSNISRSVSSNYIRDTTTNTLTTYFMVHFVYRFNIFKGGATQSDMMQNRRGPDGGRGRM
ncbi:MAG: outer membrane beta-barrel protein [Fermentimonas sp.]|nr:outer membrane beta-barrel protein [Fermentimonas sp.]